MIWLVAAIGLLTGAGLYALAIFTTALGFIALSWLRLPRPRLGEPSILPEPHGEPDEM